MCFRHTTCIAPRTSSFVDSGSLPRSSVINDPNDSDTSYYYHIVSFTSPTPFYLPLGRNEISLPIWKSTEVLTLTEDREVFGVLLSSVSTPLSYFLINPP